MARDRAWEVLAVDLDGTIVVDGERIRPAVWRSLRVAVQRGVRVVLATGRGAQPALRYALRLQLRTPVICYQGGMICDPGTGRPIYERTLSPETAIQIVRWGRARGRHLLLFAEDQMWAEDARYPQALYDRWMGLPLREVPSLEELLSAGRVRRIHKLIDLLPERERGAEEAVPWRTAFEGRVQVVRSHPMFLEILAPDASKGRALAWLAARWGVPRERVIAVGDAENDLSMIRWAGLGIAMGQADARVRAEADWVAPPVDEDGVVAVVERFILNGGAA